MITCPYCGNSGDYYFTIYSRTYCRCFGCDLIYQILPETYDYLAANNREDYFGKYSVDQIEGSRNILFSHALDLIESRKNRGRLLDVGTGCGFFLIAAQKRGWAVKGVEPSVQSVEVAQRQNDLDVFCGTLREYDGNSKFEAITFINVLDHSPRPWLEIDRASRLLVPGGLLYIRFPNGFLHSRIYHIAHGYGLSDFLSKLLVFHMYAFTPKYIKRLLHDKGFVQVTVLNSLPSEGDPHKLFRNPTFAFYIKNLLYLLATAARSLSSKNILLGTSLEVIAVKRTAQHHHRLSQHS